MNDIANGSVVAYPNGIGQRKLRPRERLHDNLTITPAPVVGAGSDRGDMPGGYALIFQTSGCTHRQAHRTQVR